MAIIREVHTTFYSKSAADIISAALNYVGTGQCYTSNSAARTARSAKFENHPNGEVLITWNDRDISSWRLVSYVRGNNDINARKWLAWQIKDVVHKELERECTDVKHRLWKRDNKQVSKYLTEKAGHDITIQEAYCIYDILMDRKNVDKRFPKKLIEDFRGTENDPFKTEMEVQRRNEVKLITDEYQKKIDNANVNSYYTDIRKQMDAEISAIRKRYEAESKKLMAELTVERDNKLKELNEQFAALNAIQLTPKQTQLRFSCQRHLLPLTAFLQYSSLRTYNINVSKIEIYSSDYDDNQDVCNNGMNGKVFVTTDSSQYECYNAAEALDGLDFDTISEIVLYYQKNGVQYFKKLNCYKDSPVA